jgi:uncharacterized protein involved in exopolysaccharide biosynthesis/Mrp family chromosome partitioning ATPase
MELRHYWQIIAKRYRTLLWISGVTVGLIIFLSLLVTPVYRFTSKIWIKTVDPKSGILSVLPSEFSAFGVVSSDLVMQGQFRLIQNYSLMRNVITDLKLKTAKEKLYAVQDILNPSSLKLARQKIGVKVSIPQSTPLLEVDGFSDEPAQAVEIANEVAEQFVKLYNDLFRREAKQAYQFIENIIPGMNAELQKTEEALQEFRSTNHVSNIGYYREKLLSSLVTLEDNKDSAGRELIETEKRTKQILGKLKKIPEFQNSTIGYQVNPRIDYIRKKIADIEAEIASSTQKITPRHVNVLQLQASLDQYKEQIRKEIKETFNTRTKTRNSYHDSLIEALGNADINLALIQARQQVFQQQIADKQQQLDQLSKIEMEQGPLDRRANAIKIALTKLLNDEQSARLASESSLSNAVVIEKAFLPSQADHLKKFRWFPKRTLMVILAAILSLFLGLMVIFFQEYLNDTIMGPQDAESALELPVLGNLPDLGDSKSLELSKIMEEPAWQEGIWHLRAMLRSQKISSGIFAITSALPKEGKTLVTASLGQVLALEQSRVLLVDLNFNNPNLGDLNQFPSRSGLREVLKGKISLNECIKPFGSGELYILPNGQANGEPLGYWDPEELAAVLVPLKSEFNFLLLDLPAIDKGEGALFTKLADQTLLVIAANQTSKNSASRALADISRFGGRVFGLILNNFRPASYSLHELWTNIRNWQDQWIRWAKRFANRKRF